MLRVHCNRDGCYIDGFVWLRGDCSAHDGPGLGGRGFKQSAYDFDSLIRESSQPGGGHLRGGLRGFQSSPADEGDRVFRRRDSLGDNSFDFGLRMRWERRERREGEKKGELCFHDWWRRCSLDKAARKEPHALSTHKVFIVTFGQRTAHKRHVCIRMAFLKNYEGRPLCNFQETC
jgi:hypothetical protein